MASLNSRGGRLDIPTTASSDIVRSAEVQSNGSARDISSATITAVVKDDLNSGDGYGSTSNHTETTYSQTITDGANGLWTFKIPYTAFTGKEGTELSYEVFMTESGNRTALMYGAITVEEVL